MYLTPRGKVIKDYNAAEMEYRANLATIEPDFYEFLDIFTSQIDFPDIKSYVDYIMDKAGIKLYDYTYEIYTNNNGERRIRVIVNAVVALDMSIENVNIQSLLS
ncbi:MAG: hypothetical protein QXS19_08975 [Candidatus Methanomethylicia archaeon]